jgi:hypothetical protein
MGYGDEFLVFAVVGYVFQLFSVAAVIAAAGAAFYAATQIKKLRAETRKQTRLLRKLAGEEPEAEAPKEDA